MENHPSQNWKQNSFCFIDLFRVALCRLLLELSKVHSSVSIAQTYLVWLIVMAPPNCV